MGLFGFGKKPDPQKHVDQAVAHIQAGEPEKAMAGLEEALELDPDHGQALYTKGTILSDAGQHEQAIECYARAAEHAGEKAQLPLFNLANAYQELGRLDEALATFRKVTEIAPEMADAWINAGRLIDDTGGHEEAVACYDRALQFAPDDVMAWSNRGNSLRSLGRIEEARDSYRQALARDNQEPAALLGMGICLGWLGDPQKGLDYLELGLQIVEHPAAVAEMGTMYAQLGAYTKALESIDRSMELGNVCAEVWNNRGEVLVHLLRPEQALASFDEALALDPQFAPAWFGKARVLSNHDRKAEALECVQQYFACTDGNDGLTEAAEAMQSLCQE